MYVGLQIVKKCAISCYFYIYKTFFGGLTSSLSIYLSIYVIPYR
jgi:hypothetical protein